MSSWRGQSVTRTDPLSLIVSDLLDITGDGFQAATVVPDLQHRRRRYYTARSTDNRRVWPWCGSWRRLQTAPCVGSEDGSQAMQ